jgi:GAF domain-containing protein
MMEFVRQRILRVQHQYPTTLDQHRAQRLLWITEAIFAVGLVWVALQVIPNLVNRQPVDPTVLSGLLAAFIFSSLNYVLIQRGRLRAANWFTVLAMAFVGLVGIIGWPDGRADISGTFVMLSLTPIVAAGVLLSRRGILLIGLSLMAIVVAGAIAQSQDFSPQTLIPANQVSFDATVAITSIFIVVIFLLMFNSNAQKIAAQSLKAVQRQESINNIGRELAQLEGETEIMNRALRLARVHFDPLVIHLYVLDNDGNLYDPRPAEVLPKRRLAADASIIGEAGRTRQVATTSIRDAIPGRNSHLLASAAYAAAVPIVTGQTLLGVVDVQSSEVIRPSELDMIATLGNQIALALQHARVVAGLRQSLRDQQDAVERLQNQLQTYTQRSRDQVGDIWSTYVRGRGAIAFGYDITDEDSQPVRVTDLPSNLARTLVHGNLSVEQNNGEQIINIPIKFRDYHLGAMSFAVPEGQALSQRQIETAEIIANRLAVALENTRLLEQSSEQALRERKASEVTAQLISATDVREVLNRAAEQFKEALGAVNTHIYIQPDMLLDPLAPMDQEKA